ncbi:hypothetical protein DRO59_05265 [Candidatus Bathyarchaeota archaeon]|nr:MAG: hypothetical protein DRO59_05265 [Candidatus Bathyarchaeota archaeon]
MNRKNLILILGLICASFVLLAPLAQAQWGSWRIIAWTDKAEYSAGQTGTLYITYNNDRDDPITIRNITITFEEWRAYINNKWVGNVTYTPKENEKTVTEHTARMFEVSFTVPSDGRAKTTNVSIIVSTNEPVPDSKTIINGVCVVETPVYMDQIVTIFTIQVVLLIICTIIIAATIFLSARRPQITWRREEVKEGE